MAARGIKLNHDGITRMYAGYASTDFLDLQNSDFSMCGWMNITGAQPGSNGEGQILFYMPRVHNGDNGGITIMASDANTATPWSIFGRLHNGGGVQDTSMTAAPAANENWFFGVSWNHTTQQATWFYAIDGAGSVSSVAGTAGYAYVGSPCDGIYIGDPDYAASNKGCNMETTNHKYWSVTKDATAMLAEMTSEDVVSSTGLLAHYKLADHTDTTDYSGNSRTLTMTGSVTDGSMDPVDIQGGGAAPRRIFVVS